MSTGGQTSIADWNGVQKNGGLRLKYASIYAVDVIFKDKLISSVAFTINPLIL